MVPLFDIAIFIRPGVLIVADQKRADCLDHRHGGRV
jgi:hypothetical protein